MSDWLTRQWRRFRAYLVVPVLAFGYWLACQFSRAARRQSLAAQYRAELEALEAGEDAKRYKAQYGAEVARRQAVRHYNDAKAALSEEQQIRARALLEDPVKLARFLVRVRR